MVQWECGGGRRRTSLGGAIRENSRQLCVLRHDASKTEDNAFGRLIILNIQQIVFEKSLNEQKNNVKRSVLATGANENIDSLCNITYFTIETNE